MRQAYDELCGYTLGLMDEAFVHQHVVDAFIAQTADARTRTISLTFALVGLHLMIDRGRSGREVQRVHTLLAQRRRVWPGFEIPEHRGSVTPADVMAAPEGPERVQAIRTWCESVWQAYAACRPTVVALLEECGIG